jgi:YjbE family integral membrane protein
VFLPEEVEMQINVAVITTLLNVILIDAVLAVDNAIVLGTAAAKLSPVSRKKAIFLGVGAAAILRACFAVFAVRLLSIPGLSLAGGVMLLWVAWKLWRDVSTPKPGALTEKKLRSKNAASTLRHAVIQILIADVSMSLDNVLAVAGAAREHIEVMVVGLVFSVVLMGFAANLLARVIHKYPWISYIGVAVILYVSCSMMRDGSKALGIIR